MLTKAEERILQGRDIADLVTAGREMGRLLEYAYEVQLEEGIRDKEVLKDMVKQKLKTEQAQKKSRV